MLLDTENRKKLEALNNNHVLTIVEETIELCKPEKVKVVTDSDEDAKYVRKLALKNGEEDQLALEGHTYHFDSYYDQARDKEHTKYLIPEGEESELNHINKEEGLKEIISYLDGSMKGKEMIVRFFSLGPNDSPFSIPAMQITDSAYVAHSEDILYRRGYEDFRNLNGSDEFFHFIHSAGRLEDNVTADIDKRRIYIDLDGDRVLSVNNQYAGNSLGLKKLAFRLAINKASKEDWMAEHMFITGVHGPNNRVSYFTGAFPSGCGKTSTAMIPGQTIVGDDIAYLRPIDGEIKAANVERGVFGIIRDVNPDDDPVIYKTLTTPRELIVSNVLINNGTPYWLGMGQELPEEGINFSGKWQKGKTDKDGNEIPAAHKNARYTIRINDLDNADKKSDSPEGVPIQGIVYGGRDSDTSVPVAETLSWTHGVFNGACIESETTAATLGKEGERAHNPMANLDFLPMSIGDYVSKHLRFGEEHESVPQIYTVNYFLKDEEGNYLNGILDKKIWMQWMDGRAHDEYDAIETPIGNIPEYEDLKELFPKYLDKEYSKEEYINQFSVRIDKYIAKLDRMEEIFSNISNVPEKFWDELKAQRERLEETKEEYGKDVVSPLDFK